MNRAMYLPTSVRAHSYAAAIFVGSAATAAILGVYAVVFGFVGGAERLSGPSVVFNLFAAGFCGLSAWMISAGHVSSFKALERMASVALVLAYATALVEFVGAPARAELLTTHCLLIVIAGGVVIRRRRVLLGLLTYAVTAWAITVGVVSAPHFDPAAWWSTWLIAVAIAYAAHMIATTERGVEHSVRREAESISWRDTLTGLSNRRGLAEQAEQLMALGQRRGETVWCAFVDVDHFKSVNDLMGHDAGDSVLVAVGAALRAMSRASDLCSRWGGDEFVALGLGDAPEEIVMERRVSDHVSQLDPAIRNLWTPAVTVGVASISADDADAFTTVINAADHRMYARREARRALAAHSR